MGSRGRERAKSRTTPDVTPPGPLRQPQQSWQKPCILPGVATAVPFCFALAAFYSKGKWAFPGRDSGFVKELQEQTAWAVMDTGGRVYAEGPALDMPLKYLQTHRYALLFVPILQKRKLRFRGAMHKATLPI